MLESLPKLDRQMVDADLALQATPLAYHDLNGAPVPFMFCRTIEARFVFQGIRTKQRSLAFGLIKLSKRQQKVVDLRFKIRLIPGEDWLVGGSDALTFQLFVPDFLDYSSSSNTLTVNKSASTHGWRATISDGELLLSKADDAKKLDELEHLQLLAQTMAWGDTTFRKYQINLPEEFDYSSEKIHFHSLLHTQEQILLKVSSIADQGLENKEESAGSWLTDIDPVLGSGFSVNTLRADMLASIDIDGFLVLKGKPNDGQQVDIKTTLISGSSPVIDIQLNLPDILTSGRVWRAVADALIAKAADLRKEMKLIIRAWSESSRKKQREFVSQLKVLFESKDKVAELLQERVNQGKISIVRLKQGKTTDRELIWIHDLSDQKSIDLIFAVNVRISNYPVLEVKSLSKIALVYGIYEKTAYRTRDAELWDLIPDYNRRLLRMLLQWFELVDE